MGLSNYATRGWFALFALMIAVLGLGMPVEAGVWAHYSFDSDFSDVSGNGQNGTLTDVGTIGDSGITTTAGDVKFGGGALDLSAERDYVEVPSKTFGTGTAYSIAFWAKKAGGDTGDPATWDMVCGRRGDTIFFIGLNDASGSGSRTGLRWRSNTAAAGDREENFVASDDTSWHHYVITADSSKNLSFYLDGQFQRTQPNVETGFIIDTIGEAYSNSRDFDFHGQIDEMWIFDEAIDANEVQGLHLANDPQAVLSDEVLYHRYDGGFTDSSSSINDGTANGNAVITTDAADVVAGSGALELDGADGSYDALDSFVVFSNTDEWSATWWAKRGELGAQKGMVMGRRNSTSDFIWLNDSWDGLRFRSTNNVTHDFTVSQDTMLHHYALVADGAGNLSLYLDGQWLEDSSGNTSFTIDTIGQAYTTTSLHLAFQGILDEVRLFDKALTGTQVGTIYNEEKPATPVDRIRVFLLGGQSNADGRAPTGDLPTSPVNLQVAQADIDFYYRVQGSAGALTTLRPGLSETSQFGPEITMGRRLADLFGHGPETRLAIIKYANGGTDLENEWKAGGDGTTTGDGPDYVTFQQTVTDGLAALAAAYPSATIEIEGMAWLQGESDVQGGHQANYQANLTAFIADVRDTFGADLPFVIIRLSSGQTALNAAGLAVVRAAMDAVAAADPRTGLIDTDSFGIKADVLHFNGDGLQDIGAASGEELVFMRWMLDTFPAAAIDVGDAEWDADFDGDLRSNGDEWVAGTLADDPLSFLSATITRTPPDGVDISYPAAAGRQFAIEVWNALTGSWSELLPAEAGSGGSDSRDFTAGDPANLYRVRAQLP